MYKIQVVHLECQPISIAHTQATASYFHIKISKALTLNYFQYIDTQALLDGKKKL